MWRELSVFRLKTTRDQPRMHVGVYHSPSMCNLSPEIARISTRSYWERGRTRSGKRLSQVHSLPTSSYPGGRSSRSSREGARPFITEPIKRSVNGSEYRLI